MGLLNRATCVFHFWKILLHSFISNVLPFCLLLLFLRHLLFTYGNFWTSSLFSILSNFHSFSGALCVEFCVFTSMVGISKLFFALVLNSTLSLLCECSIFSVHEACLSQVLLWFGLFVLVSIFQVRGLPQMSAGPWLFCTGLRRGDWELWCMMVGLFPGRPHRLAHTSHLDTIWALGAAPVSVGFSSRTGKILQRGRR